MLWKQPATLEGLNALNINTMPGYLGIIITEVGPDPTVSSAEMD